MIDTVRAGIGLFLMAAGMVAVGYSVYLEMIGAVPLRWWDRALLLAPAGVLAILSGLVLTV